MLKQSGRLLQVRCGTAAWPIAQIEHAPVGPARVEDAQGRVIDGSGGGRSRSLSRKQQVRSAALKSFCEPFPGQCEPLRELSPGEWKKLLRWLDLSGLALQFFDRVAELRLEELLPEPVYARLRQNLQDNAVRTSDILVESTAIHQEFQREGIQHALLKGVSFWPNSVAKSELRLQFDIDFLVSEDCAEGARDILLRRGYRLYSATRTCLEFKRNEKPGLTLQETYRHTGSWAVEIHVECHSPAGTSVLDRVERRDFNGHNMPVLSPVDLFLRQGLHAYKHICGEFTRASHLVEYRHHVLTRAGDGDFWDALRAAASGNEFAAIALGVVTLLISRSMGEFAPDALTAWTVDCLPRTARLWVETYGDRVVLGDVPGSKLYLLLQKSVHIQGAPVRRRTWRSLVPLSCPPQAILARSDDPLPVRLGRYRMQLNFIGTRLRFHIVEGLRFGWELRRWRRQIRRLAT